MPTPTNKFSGLRTSEAFKKIFKGDAIAVVDGSPEDLKLWKEAVNALHEDYQQLLTWGQEQHKSIIKLRRQVGRLSWTCLLGVLFYGASVCWVARHFEVYSRSHSDEVVELQRQFETARSLYGAQREINTDLAARLTKMEQAQAASAAPTPTLLQDPAATAPPSPK